MTTPPRRTRLVRLAVAMAALLGATAGPAQAATTSSVTMFSRAGDWIGQGQSRIYYPGAATISLSGNGTSFNVSVSGGTSGDSFGLTFAAPYGQKLHPGLYLDAQRAAFRESGRAGIDISGDGRGCNEVAGAFDVKDISYTSSGAISSVWLTFEQHCEGPTAPPLYGELRYRRVRPAGAILAVPAVVAWPEAPPGGSGGVIPLTYVNESADDAAITSAALAGVNAADYSIRSNECSGVTLGPGEVCQVLLRFSPRLAGPRIARVDATDSTGRRYSTALDGSGAYGRTRVIMKSDAGDYIGGGVTRTYTWTRDRIFASGNRSYVGFSVDGADGAWWSADFAAPDSDVLAPGRFTNASRYPFNGAGPGLDVSGDGRGCNTLTGEFTVTAAAFRPSGAMRYFGANFIQHCEGATPALRGTFEYRVPYGDVTAPGRVSGLTAVRTGTAVELKWTNPTDADFARTIVRILPGTYAPGSAVSGRYVPGSSATSARFGSAVAATAAVFTVDTAGNVSRGVTAGVGPAT